MEVLDKNQRPWQGTVLGVVNIIGLVVSTMVLMLVMFGSSFLAGMADDPVFSFIFGAGALVITLFVLPLIILGVFMTIGLFKGQKWAVILMLIFTVIALISGLGGIAGSVGGYNDFGNVVVNTFLLYCEIVALKDPYYN
jgi:hypothetical protein